MDGETAYNLFIMFIGAISAGAAILGMKMGNS